MVKGNTRQAIVVRSPDTQLFEQAIFLLREDALEKHGVGEQELLEQARRLTKGYGQKKKEKKPISPLFWLGLGAAPVALSWLITLLF